MKHQIMNRRKKTLTAILSALLTAGSVQGLAEDYVFNNGTESNTVVSDSITSSNYSGIIIQSGTVQYTSASPKLKTAAQPTYVALPVQIQSGAKLYFDSGIVPNPTAAITLTVNSGGVLEFNNTDNTTLVDSGGNGHPTSNAITSATNKKVTIAGAGTVVKTGGGSISMSSSNGVSEFAMAQGGLIDIREGMLINGGYQQMVWSNNKGSVNIASGAFLNLWDGKDMYIDSITGAGKIILGSDRTLHFGTGDNYGYGTTENPAPAPVFSGSIQSTMASATAKTLSLEKQGSGTQIFTGTNYYSGTTTVTAGTLQFGNGTGTGGTIGTGAVVVNSGANLVFNTETANTIAGVLSGSGTIKTELGELIMSNAGNTFSGNMITDGNSSLTFSAAGDQTIANSIVGSGTIAFSGTGNKTLTGTLTGSGTIAVNAGNLVVANSANTFNGTVNIASGAALTLYYKSFIANNPAISAESGSFVNFYVDDSDPNMYHASDFVTFNSGASTISSANIGLYIPTGTNQSVNAILPEISNTLYKNGSGTLSLTTNSSFAAGITVQEGTFKLGDGTGTNVGALTASVVTVESGAQFTYDNGTGTTTVGTGVTGAGKLLVKSGTVLYSAASKNNGTADSYVSVAQVTVDNGAALEFDSVMPNQSQKMTMTVNSGGVLEFAPTDTASNEAQANSSCLSRSSSAVMTINGTGTLRFSGTNEDAAAGTKLGAVYSTHGSMGFNMSMGSGGLIDIQSGQYSNGGHTSQNWSKNLAAMNIAEGASFNLWNSSDVYIDGLTGAGTVFRGEKTLIVGTDNHSTFADNTAVFTGKLVGGGGTVPSTAATAENIKKVGTGTQIFAGTMNYTGTTTVSAGTLQFGNGNDTAIGTGAIIMEDAGTLAFNRASDLTLSQKISGSGTIANKSNTALNVTNSDNTFGGTWKTEQGSITVGTAATPITLGASTSFNAAEGTSITYYISGADSSLTSNGTYRGAGTINLYGNNTALDMSNAAIGMGAGGKVVLNGIMSVTTPGYADYGTLAVNDDLALNVAAAHANSWKTTLYEGDSTTGGAFRPTSNNYLSVEDKGTTTSMSAVANNTVTADVRLVMPKNYSAYSYSAMVYVPNDISVDLAGYFDDYAGVWIRQIADADGNPLTSEWKAALDFGSACAAVTSSDFNIAAGYYYMDARVGDASGNVNAYSGYKDVNGKTLGLGIRIHGDATLTDKVYAPMDIDANGYVAFADGAIQLANITNPAIGYNIDIADGKTVTIDNSDALVTSFSISGDLLGQGGTVKLTKSAEASAPFTVSGLVEGSLETGEGVDLILTSTAIGKDLALGANSILSLDSIETLDISGDFDAENATIKINMAGLDADEYAIAADSANVEGATVILSGATLQDGEIVNLIDVAGVVSGLDSMSLQIDNPWSDFRYALSNTNGSVQALVGNSSSVPEPSSWLLLGLSLVTFFGRFFKVRTK